MKIYIRRKASVVLSWARTLPFLRRISLPPEPESGLQKLAWLSQAVQKIPDSAYLTKRYWKTIDAVTETRPSSFDVVYFTDLRFPGGSSQSTLAELHAASSAGVSQAVVHVPATVMRGKRFFHPGYVDLISSGQISLLSGDAKVSAGLAVVRHPTVVPALKRLRSLAGCSTVALIVNHPPKNAAERIDYRLPETTDLIEEIFQKRPLVFPIGPQIRYELNRFGWAKLLTDEDWVNVFDIDKFISPRSAPKGRDLVIGRHSRPGPEKWPSNSEVIRKVYLPNRPGYAVKIMGGSDFPVALLGSQPRNWIDVPFSHLGVLDFLKSIDVFVYFHHPDWVEAFGRVLVEALASGLPVITSDNFRPLLRDSAIYCEPDEVVSKLEELRDAEVYLYWSEKGKAFVAQNFGYSVHLERLKHFSLLPG